MPTTAEPRGLTWINNVNTATLGSLVTNFCWLVGSLSFTWITCLLLLEHDPTGLTAMGLMLGGWGVKTTAGVFDANNKRKAHPAYAGVVEAKERGKAGARIDAALAAAAVTRDRPVVQADSQSPKQEVTVNVGAEGEANGEFRRGE